MTVLLRLVFTLLLLNISMAVTAQMPFRLGIHQNLISQYPGKNGLFWTYGIALKIFQTAGYQTVVLARPAKRLALSLKNNQIDFVSSSVEALNLDKKQYIRSELPIAMLSFYIYYNHSNSWQPVWPPDEIFKQKIGKSVHSAETLRELSGLNISLATSLDAPVKMVNMGRADYYMESKAGMVMVSAGLLKKPAQGFTTKVLFLRPIYAMFQNTPRGQHLAQLFDRASLRLYQSGEFGKVFFANAPVYVGSQTVDDAVSYINDHRPSLNIPPQTVNRVIKKYPRATSLVIKAISR